jgi:enamine deaminase RidA (YjgF/YER057c/UK114 family)
MGFESMLRGYWGVAAGFVAGAALIKLMSSGGIKRLNAAGEPWDGAGRAAPIVVHNGYVYISGQVGWKEKPGGEIDPSIEVASIPRNE